MKRLFQDSVRSSLRPLAVAVVALALTLSLSAVAQGLFASLEGYVYDSTGAVIPGATVTVTNVDNGATRSVSSDAEGYYFLGQVSSGNYEIAVSADGFAPYRRPGVRLRVGDQSKVNVTLEVAGVREEVIVTDAPSVIEPTQLGTASVIGDEEIGELPVNNRNWTELALLDSSVVIDTEFDAPASVSVNGVEGVFNNVQVDGVDNNNGFFSEIRGRTRAPFQFSQESVKEFRILKNSFSAEYGRAAGGVVNAVTKSGTNEWHGSAHWYMRDDNLSATPVLVKEAGLPKPSGNRQQFGGTIGGPIVEDKAFIFFSYDQQVREDPVSVTIGNRADELEFNPLDAFSITGDFSTSISSFLDSVDTNNFGSIDMCMDVVGCNDSPNDGITQLEADIIHQAFMNWAFGRAFFLGDASFLNQTFTTPMGQITTVNPFPGRNFQSIVRTAPRNPDQIVLFPKMDVRLNDMHNLSVQWNFQDFSSSPNGVFTAPTKADNNSADGPNSDESSSVVVGLNSVFTPTLLNEFRFQFSNDDDDFGSNAEGLARVRLDDFDFAGSSSLPRFVHETKMQFQDNYSIITGQHQIRLGVDIIRTEDDNFFPGTFFGSYSFRGPGHFIEFARGYVNEIVGDPVQARNYFGIDVATGTGPVFPKERRRSVNNYSQRFGIALTPLTTWDYGFYVQDTFRWRPEWTFNFGVRIDKQKLQDPLLPNPLFTESAFIPDGGTGVAPRLGVAWSPQSNLVIRASAGIFYLRRSQIDVTNAITGNNAYSFNQFLSSSALRDSGALDFNSAALDPLNLAASDFPILSAPTNACPAPPACSDPFASVSGFAPEYENGYSTQSSIEVQWEVMPNTSFTLGYAHTQGTKLPRNRNINLLNPAPNGSFQWTFQDQVGNVIATAMVPDYNAGSFANRITSDFSAVNLTESAASSVYDAMTISLDRRWTNGLTYGISYTRSENNSDLINGINTGGVFFSDLYDQFDPASDYGTARLDQPNNFVMRTIWEPQNWKDSEGSQRWVLDGWSFGFIYTTGSGRVLTPVVDTDINRDNSRTAFGDGDRVPFLRRNSFRTQNKNNLDISVYKSFDVGEGRTLQFRAQAFNAANRATFTQFNDVMFESRGGNTAVLSDHFLEHEDRARRNRDVQLGLVFRF